MSTPKTVGTALTRQAKTTSRGLATSDGLENLAAAIGGQRDKMSYNTWERGRILVQRELENMWRTSWLAKKIIEIPADDMTREWRTVTIPNDDGPLKKKFEAAERKFKVKPKMHEAILWARLYGGSLLIVGTKDGMRDPSTELIPENVKKGDLKYLHVVDRWRVSPSPTLTKDITSPNFGLPEWYMIVGSQVQIHWTRVIRFNGAKLPYQSWLENAMWDDPIMVGVVEALQNREISVKSVATMMFEANVDVVSGVGLGELMSSKGGEAKLAKRFMTAALMKSFNRVFLLDETEKYEKKSNQFANLDKVMQEMTVDASGAARIPITRLFEQSPAGMSATGEYDTRNYYDRISNDQEADLRERLEFLDQILYRSEVGDMPEDFTFDFNDLWQLSETETATVRKTQAETDKIYAVDIGAIDAGGVARELQDRKTYATMTDTDVELVTELSKPIEGDPLDPAVGFRSTKAADPKPVAVPKLDPVTGLPMVGPDGEPIMEEPLETQPAAAPNAEPPTPPKGPRKTADKKAAKK